MSTLKVDAIRHNSATSDAITTAADGTCTAKLTSIGGGGLSHRNLIINGAMNVSQRGTSFSGTAQQYTLDRMQTNTVGNDEIAQTEQAAVTSGGAYTSGFRKCMKIINGNQTSGAGAGDIVHLKMVLEAQDIANSGWNYTSSSSFITLSFWIKSSVAQDFPIVLRSEDGTRQVYNMTTGSLTADTWTKVTKTIPGNSNLQFDDNVNAGLTLFVNAFVGTDYTTGSLAQNAWSAWSGTKQGDNMTSTWYTTNNATLEITGIQLEVGDTATSFEHRSYGEELSRCQRYYEETYVMTDAGNSYIRCPVFYKVEKRAAGTPVSYAKRPDGVGTGAANKSYQASGERDTVCNYSWTGGTMVFVTGYASNTDCFSNVRVDVGDF